MSEGEGDAGLVPGRGCLTIRWVARRLGISETTVRRLIQDGTLPALHYPGCRIVKVRTEDLEAYLMAARAPRG